MHGMDWTSDMDDILREGLKQGLSARLISDQLGVTRNAVLGRTYRLKLSGTIKRKRKPVAGLKPGPKTDSKRPTGLYYRPRVKINPNDYLDDIMDLRDMGYQWNDIAQETGLTVAKVREIAIIWGGYVVKQVNHFDQDEIDYIIKAWKEHVPVEEIADKLGRSFGVIRQKIHQLNHKGLLKDFNRDAAKTRLLRHYGVKALEYGATPQEALRNIAEAKQRAVAEAMNAARKSASKRRSLAVETMLADIAAGVERDEAIFRARCDSARLEEIGDAFDPPLTRERIRQICTKQAEIIALKKLAGEE